MNKTDIPAMIEVLKANDYVVLKAKSYRQAQERQRVAEALRQCEVDHAESVRNWARNCLEEERRLMKRCEYLYGLAVRHGATDDELRGSL